MLHHFGERGLPRSEFFQAIGFVLVRPGGADEAEAILRDSVLGRLLPDGRENWFLPTGVPIQESMIWSLLTKTFLKWIV